MQFSQTMLKLLPNIFKKLIPQNEMKMNSLTDINLLFELQNTWIKASINLELNVFKNCNVFLIKNHPCFYPSPDLVSINVALLGNTESEWPETKPDNYIGFTQQKSMSYRPILDQLLKASHLACSGIPFWTPQHFHSTFTITNEP